MKHSLPRNLVLLAGAILAASFSLTSSFATECELGRHHFHHEAATASEMVFFNTSTLKFHKPSCIWAQRCTKNCISITREEAVGRGGVPCKVCGG